jgi:hypothetical protein
MRFRHQLTAHLCSKRCPILEIHTCSASAFGIFFFLYGSHGRSPNSIERLMNQRLILIYPKRRLHTPNRAHARRRRRHVVGVLLVVGILRSNRATNLTLVQELGLELLATVHQYKPKQDDCSEKEERRFHCLETTKKRTAFSLARRQVSWRTRQSRLFAPCLNAAS